MYNFKIQKIHVRAYCELSNESNSIDNVWELSKYNQYL